MRIRNTLTKLAAFAVVLAAQPLAAMACPTCKEGLAENGAAGANLARGFELSIYLMLAVPMLIFAGLAFFFSMQIRKAQRSGTYPTFDELVAASQANAIDRQSVASPTSAS